MDNGTAFTDKPGWQEMQFIEETDGRDPRLAQSIRTPGLHANRTDRSRRADVRNYRHRLPAVKFVQDPTSNSNNNDRVDSSDCDMPVYRFGEVLLIYAEAKAELGTLTQDDLTISINKLRDRVGMPPLDMAKANAKPDWYLSSEEYGYPNVTGANAGVILEIRRERTTSCCKRDIVSKISSAGRPVPASIRRSPACISPARASTTLRATARPT